MIATQIYKFVAPGLYKNERRAFLPYLIATPVLFVIGAMVVYLCSDHGAFITGQAIVIDGGGLPPTAV